MRLLSGFRLRLRAAAPSLVFLFSLGFFGGAALWRQADIRAEAQTQTKNINERLTSEVANLLKKPIYGLNGARGLFAANQSINRAAFKAYVDFRDLSQEFPGVRGFSFNPLVLRSELAAFVAATRTDGAPNFTVRQLADRSHDDMYIVKYIEPAKNNPRALGLDIGSNPLRRQTVQQAVDSGKPSMSEPIRLLQSKQQTPGTLLMVPVYQNGSHPADLRARRRANIGVLVAPVVLAELFSELHSSAEELMRIQIFDNKAASPSDRLIFDSLMPTGNHYPASAAKQKPLHVAEQRLSLFGRELSVKVSSLPKFEKSIDTYTPWLIFGVGAMASATLALYLRQRLREYNVVAKLVEQRTIELNRANESAERDRERLTLATRAGGVGVWDWDVVNNILYWDESMYALYGISANQFSGAYDAMQNGVHPGDRLKADADIHAALEFGEFDTEFRVVWPDESIRHIQAHGSVIRDSNGKPLRMVGTNWDVSNQKISEAKIEELAYFDQLTSLPNRRLFADRFQRAIVLSDRNSRHGALLYIDLDNFKAVNDIRGHGIGDQVLQAAARNLSDCIRASDTLTRIGGDEFIILLEDLGDSSSEAALAAEIVAMKILKSFSPGMIVPTFDWIGTVSIGITLFFGARENDIEEIIKQSDLALYRAKADGRNRLQFYDKAMQEAITAKSSMEQLLFDALDNEWFELYYQAQLNSKKCLVAAEALLRLNHPINGIIPPGDFIPLAESSDLILRIGDYVLTEACAQLAIWARSPVAAQLNLAINISVKQFQQPDFVDKVITIIDRSGANPKLLILEITENIFLGDTKDVAAKMQTLQSYGISFSIDDFGTGYSSLSYLKSFRFDHLKIDKSFIFDIAQNSISQGIVRSAISMGINLGLEVIAEGVEIEEQFNFLIESGCEYFQGYLFSRPLPLAEFTALLNLASSVAPARRA